MRLHLFFATLVGLAAPSAQAVSKAECVQASDRGQDLRDQGKLKAARERFLTCGLEACPSVVRTQCHAWLAEVEGRLPTVLLRVRDPAGNDVLQVRVSIDGEVSARGLDGRSLPLDPGVHVFRFEAAGLEASELKVLIRESEKDRLLDVTMRPPLLAQPVHEEPPALAPVSPAPPPAVSTTKPSLAVPVLTASLGGVALLGAGAFAYFGNDARTRVDHLRSTCAPDCASSDVTTAMRQATIANTSLVIGAVAAAGAVTLLLWRPRWTVDAPAVGAGPVPGGVVGWVAGTF